MMGESFMFKYCLLCLCVMSGINVSFSMPSNNFPTANNLIKKYEKFIDNIIDVLSEDEDTMFIEENMKDIDDVRLKISNMKMILSKIEIESSKNNNDDIIKELVDRFNIEKKDVERRLQNIKLHAKMKREVQDYNILNKNCRRSDIVHQNCPKKIVRKKRKNDDRLQDEYDDIRIQEDIDQNHSIERKGYVVGYVDR